MARLGTTTHSRHSQRRLRIEGSPRQHPLPGSTVGGGNTITAGFAGNSKGEQTIAFRHRALIRGRLHDPAGNPVANAQVCLQAHTDLPGRPYHLIGAATTNENGGWTFKLSRGPSRSFRVAYRFGAFQTSTDLSLHMRARATLHLSRHRTRAHHRIYFSGRFDSQPEHVRFNDMVAFQASGYPRKSADLKQIKLVLGMQFSAQLSRGRYWSARQSPTPRNRTPA